MDAIHVIGAGGIGLAVGHTLARNGVAVTFVETAGDKLADGLRHGVRVNGRPAVRAAFVAFADWQPPPEGVVLLCTKCPANRAVLDRLPPSVRLVPIQNGYDPALEASPAHVEGIASFVSECIPGQAHTRITRGGALHLGLHPGSSSAIPPGLDAVADALAVRLSGGPFTLRRVADIRPWKATKLMYNAAISPLAAAAGLDNGELLRRRRLRALFFALLRENDAILRHAGVPLERIGPLRPATVARILAWPWLANALAWAFYPSLRGTYCSMAPDLRHATPAGTEIDHYNGHLIRLAGDYPCPLNRGVYALIRRMERDRLPPSPTHLDALWPLLAAGDAAFAVAD